MIRFAPSMPYLLAPNDPSGSFPDVREALREPEGLLAVGGDLGIGRLLNAYRHGIFPWYSSGDPILWWSPDPRTVLLPSRVHLSASLRKLLRRQVFTVTMDQDFPAVITACAAPREPGGSSWLVPEMIGAYRMLHVRGHAHSVEVWQDGALVGGLYGVAIGGAFFGESMFSRASNASKVALVHLCQRLADWDFGLIDCQVLTEHLLRMGAVQVARTQFIELLQDLRDRPTRTGAWSAGGPSHPQPLAPAPSRWEPGLLIGAGSAVHPLPTQSPPAPPAARASDPHQRAGLVGCQPEAEPPPTPGPDRGRHDAS